jgi:RHS repeat-associated protein
MCRTHTRNLGTVQLSAAHDLTAGTVAQTAYAYDELGRPAETQDPDEYGSAAGSFAVYDYLGRPTSTSTVDLHGGDDDQTTETDETQYYYADQGGWLSSQRAPSGTQTSYQYDNLGHVTTQTDGAGIGTFYGYDVLGRQTSTFLPDQDTASVSYDMAGLQTQTKLTAQVGDAPEVLAQTNYQYTTDGQVAGQTEQQSASTTTQTTYTYDPTGLLTGETQQAGTAGASAPVSVEYGYDLFGDQTAYTDGNGGGSTPYDASLGGSTPVQASASAASPHTTFTTYNAWGLPETTLEPPVSTANYTYTTLADEESTSSYNADGGLVTQTQPGGVEVDYTYDGLGDLTAQSGSGASATTANRTYGYDPDGQVTSAATSNTLATGSNATSEQFAYDNRGMLTSSSGSAGTSSFTYTGDGLMQSRSDASGTNAYTYDGDDRLQTDQDASTGTTLHYGYNGDDQLQTVTYGSSGTGDVRTFGYDLAGEVQSDELQTPAQVAAQSGSVDQLSYTYDDLGELLSKTDSAGYSNTYTYDQAGRLASWSQTPPGSSSTKQTAYSYDADSNRTAIATTPAGGSTTTTSYTYDARDQLVTGGSDSYTYTADGDVSNEAATGGSGTANTAFADDAYGQQITAGAESYTYDTSGRMVALANSVSGTGQSFTYSGADDLLSSDASDTYSRDPSGNLVGSVIGAGSGGSATPVLLWTDLHTDVVGSFTPTATSMAGLEQYDPLGNVLTTTGDNQQLTVGYQSEWTDSTTGEVNMDARWYNPASGQFLNKDTQSNSAVPNTASANPFAYADGDPLTNTDPSGHLPMEDVDGRQIVGTYSANKKTVHSIDEGKVEAYDAYMNWMRLSRTHPAAVKDKPVAIGALTLPADFASPADMGKLEAGYDTELNAGMMGDGNGAMPTAYDELVAEDWTCEKNDKICGSLTRTLDDQKDQISSLMFGLNDGSMGSDLEEWSTEGNLGTADHEAGEALETGQDVTVEDTYDYLAEDDALDDSGDLEKADVAAEGADFDAATDQSIDDDIVSSAKYAEADLASEESGQKSAVKQKAASREHNGSPETDSGKPDADSGAGNAPAQASAPESESVSTAAAPSEGEAAPAAQAPHDEGGGGASGSSGGVGESQQMECGQSFTGDTQVVTSSGQTVAISSLKAGDTVESTDPSTGKDASQTVEDVMVNHDDDLYDLSVETSHGAVVIHTTSNHLFWDETTGSWLQADLLHVGDHLLTADGSTATAAGGSTPQVETGWMWDLTVSDFHTFYVVAGNTPVLVHNCDETIPNVALGTQDNGLGKFATDNGYTVFTDMTRDDALAKVQDVANYHDETTIHVRLDGFKMTDGSTGATPGQLFDDAVTQGQGEDWYTTQKEMAILERANRVGNLPTSRLRFYMGGNDVTGDVLQQSQYLGG